MYVLCSRSVHRHVYMNLQCLCKNAPLQRREARGMPVGGEEKPRRGVQVSSVHIRYGTVRYYSTKYVLCTVCKSKSYVDRG